MQTKTLATEKYLEWKPVWLEQAGRSASCRHASQNSFYGKLLLQNLEKKYPDFSFLQVNDIFADLANEYSGRLRAEYGYEREEAKTESINNPVFLEFMKKLEDNNFLFNPEIKRIAPLIVQSYRTSGSQSGENFCLLAHLPKDCLYLLASFLQPTLNNAGKEMQFYIDKAKEHYEDIYLFSFDKMTISFSSEKGTHVLLKSSHVFNTWFCGLPDGPSCLPDEPCFGLFRPNGQANVLAVNSGPGTYGIQIKKLANDSFEACNNQVTDEGRTSDKEKERAETTLCMILNATKRTLQAKDPDGFCNVRLSFFAKIPQHPLLARAIQLTQDYISGQNEQHTGTKRAAYFLKIFESHASVGCKFYSLHALLNPGTGGIWHSKGTGFVEKLIKGFTKDEQNKISNKATLFATTAKRPLMIEDQNAILDNAVKGQHIAEDLLDKHILPTPKGMFSFR